MELIRALALGALVSLAACGDGAGPLGDAASDLMNRGGGPTELSLTRAQTDAIAVPVIRVRGPRFGDVLMGIVGTSGGSVVWMDALRNQIVTRGGLLTGTHGLGDDLMGLTNVAIERDGATRPADLRDSYAQRIYEHQGDGLEMQVRGVACTRTTRPGERIIIVERAYNTILVVENCRGSGLDFTNQYWFSIVTGALMRSRQWVGEDTGLLQIDVINPF